MRIIVFYLIVGLVTPRSFLSIVVVDHQLPFVAFDYKYEDKEVYYNSDETPSMGAHK
jgi:hypothetical protein